VNVGRVLVKACLNGPRDPAEHPAIPVTPEELAREAKQAVAAGAGAIHIHPRDADGRESLDPEDCAGALEAVRRACPGVPIGLTTGLWIARDVAHRRSLIRSWRTLPDFVSVNFSEDGAEELAELALSRRIGIEPGLWAVSDAQRLVASGLARQSLRILVEIDEDEDPTSALSLAQQIDQVLDWHTIDQARLHHGHGLATWAVIERAIGRGYDIRIGLEDTLAMPDGRQARDNAELVAGAIARIPAAREHSDAQEPARA
jgi:uncharacterized protein (DUF849 family)